MKKNLLIMMMMVLCAGFASAQTINTVHGFVPGGSTGDGDNATYVVFGVPFSTIDADGPKEMSVTLAQMQLVYDTVEDVITCGQPYNANGISLSADSIQSLVICNKEDNNQEGQRAYLKLQIPNGAQYNYDSLLVVNLYICPCTKTDDESNDYEIIALDSKCWFKSNMRREDGGNGLLYNSDMTEVQDDSIYGRLYTWETVLKGDVCDNDGYLRGICPEGWHLPTVEEMGYLFGTPAENLRYDGNWVVEGNNNVTEFSAQPAGFYNASTQRFEGMFSETDFWMVNCNKLNEPQQEILQLVYSCNTPLRIVRPDEDALSVRCVYDIIKKLEDCDTNQNPTPNPPPTPIPDDVTCPEVGDFTSQVTADGVQISFNISNYEGKLNNQHVDSENPELVGSVLGHYYINLRPEVLDPGADESGPNHFYVLTQVEPLIDATVPTLHVTYFIPFGDTFNPSTIASIYPGAEVYLIDSLEEECGDGGILYPDGDEILFQH